MSNIFVIAYDVPRPNLGATQALNYWHRAEGTPQTIQTSVEPHFIGKFTAPVFQRIQYLPANTGIPQVIETTVEPHFIGKFTPPVFQRIKYEPDIQGQPQVIDNVGANPHFIGKFTAPTFTRIPYNSSSDIPPPIIIGEAQPHFIGRFTAPVFQRAINSWDTNGQPFVLDTIGANPHFIGSFTQPVYKRIPYFSTADIPPVVPPFETNTHFIGKFSAPTFQRAINSWSVQGQPFVVDTVGANPHFVGTFKAPIYRKIPYDSWCTDFPIVQAVDLPVNFLGKFNPTVFYNSVSYLSYDSGVPFVPPPPETTVSSGRQIWSTELDDLTLATHKWHQRLIESNQFKTGEEIKKIAQTLGSLGGKARAENLTPQQRTNIASKAAQTRWQSSRR